MKKLFADFDKLMSVMDEKERTRIGKEILQLHADNVWIIGTAGNDPAFGMAKKNLGNVPTKSIMSGPLNWTKFQRPEQFYWK
jgi:peptide/nickel transport system substrate-binding protein